MGKGNITIFVIIGLIIIISLSFVMLKIPESDNTNTEDLSNEKTNTKYYIDTCLDHTTTEAVELLGFGSETAIAAYVDSRLLSCVGNFSFVKDYEISFGEPKSNVLINNEVVFVDLNFPIEIKKQSAKTKIDEFQYSLKRLTSFKLEDGLIPKGSVFFSNDENLIATVDEDTEAVDNRGRAVKELSFNLLDKNFDDLNNGVVLGNIVYEGLPNGAKFDPALKITIGLKKQDLPSGYPENAPQIAWYDKDNDIWRTYPSLGYDEDENYYYYSAEVSHFTPMAIVSCGSATAGESNVPLIIPMGKVFEQRINPKEEVYWRQNPDESLHLIPETMGNATCNESDSYKTYSSEKCPSLLKDWDEDEGEYTAVDDDCLALCQATGLYYLSCYYTGENCESTFGLTEDYAFALKPELLYNPFSETKPLLSELSIFAKSVSLACTSDVCSLPEKAITPEVVDDNEYIKSTFEKSPKVFATPKTYGYNSVQDVGGRGKFVLNIEEKGDACIDESIIALSGDSTGINLISLESGKASTTGGKTCSSGDICTWRVNGESDSKITEFHSGENSIYVDVKNTESGLVSEAYAKGYLYFKGEGISWDKSKTTDSDDGSGGGDALSELGGGSGEFYDMAAGDFKEIYPGIKIKKVDTTINPEIELPGPLVYYVAQIDLSVNPNFFVTPPQPSLMQTSAFLAQYASSQNLVLAVNGGGFEYGGGNENIGGYAMSAGKVYSSSKHKPGEATVVVDKENNIGFDKSFKGFSGAKGEIYHAVSGFQAVVIDGKTRAVHTPGTAEFKPEKGYDNKEPRTSIGIDEENNKLNLVVVDGRNPGVSIGVSLVELGKIQIHHGSTYAVNMDGGGSSTMVINQANTAMIINTPSDGNERAVANHFGVGISGGSSATLGQGGGEALSSGGTASVPTFRVISNGVAAGGQPNAAGFAKLKQMGYTTIIDLATEDSSESSTVQSLGMTYIPLALGPYISENPSSEFYTRVNKAVSYMKQGNVYVHCTHGVHRTGVVVAVYGMKNLGWTPEQAVSVMKQYGGSAWDPYSYLFDVIRNYP